MFLILIVNFYNSNIDYFCQRGIDFCFVFPGKQLKAEIVRRLTLRGNPDETIKANTDKFDEFYDQNVKEEKSKLHYEMKKNEYLEEIVQKFGIKLKNFLPKQ